MNVLQAGIIAAREGRRAEARAFLEQGLQANPRSEQAWLWMSAVVENDAECRICLERVLSINPHNQTAQAGLERLGANPTHPGNDDQSHLPVSWSHPLQGELPGGENGQAAMPPSPHAMPTLGVTPAAPDSRRIRRLEPAFDPVDGVAQLRAAQFQPESSSSPTATSQSDPFMALVLVGGLSITAIAGALLLGVLWLIGWPP